MFKEIISEYKFTLLQSITLSTFPFSESQDIRYLISTDEKETQVKNIRYAIFRGPEENQNIGDHSTTAEFYIVTSNLM